MHDESTPLPPFAAAGPGQAANAHGLFAATLPARVRRTLERTLRTAEVELDHGLMRMIDAFERDLLRLADLARAPAAQSVHAAALRNVRADRAGLIPRFLSALETALAAIRMPPPPAPAAGAGSGEISFRNLSLIEVEETDEEAVLREIAGRQERRAALPLHLLGHRFGVLAGQPAFDAARLPLGPHALCRGLREAAAPMALGHEARLLLYRGFEREVMSGYPRLLERVNEQLIADGILPALTFVPVRTRPAPQPRDADGRGPRRRAAAGDRAHTAWFGQPGSGETPDGGAAAFSLLRQLLAGRRPAGAAGDAARTLSTPELLDALRALQRRPASPPGDGSGDGILDIRHDLLAQAAEGAGAAALSPEDGDTFELLALLYAWLERELRPDAPTAGLVRQLQVPMLRMSLQDRAFLLRASHPARRLLDTVAESAARWLDPDELDPQLIEPLRRAVADVGTEFDQDPAVFERAQARLRGDLQAQARRAAAAERRHVEAARGKEKLEIARRRADAILAEETGGQPLPRFVQALLSQAWSDVLTLTLLRQGETSDAWRAQLDATRRIVACSATGRDDALAAEIEAALGQVGYHDDEARAIAGHLAGDRDADAASRTELGLALGGRARLGEERAAQAPSAAGGETPELSPDERAQYERLLALPAGAWIDFEAGPGGEVVRRRLSWFSAATGNALLVNQRGQRVAEPTLDALARQLARGEARVVEAARGLPVDRAWEAALEALRGRDGREAPPA
ncbi:DUF1631 domain-containing protein [Luteimonas sp. Y-2-2-4F]|nr:DUF1631 family protein [Luteimonas sp. Y-2-2-4F]MCD9033632.1 DUF1631 domain-containing protein [Luteimonas sp. Y-2-2-4F]